MNLTVIVQERLAARVAGQLLVSEKYWPEIKMLLMVSAVVPMLVTVANCGTGGQVCNCMSQPNDRLDGLSFTAVPGPPRATV